MIHQTVQIFPVQNVKVEPLAAQERLIVCARDREGNLRIMGLQKYLQHHTGRHTKGQHKAASVESLRRTTT